MEASGYAAVNLDSGELLVRTVSPTETAAIVNWLVAYGGVAIPNGMGEFAIRDLYATLKARGYQVEIIPVRITPHGH